MNGQQQALLSLSLAMEDEKGCVADSDRDLFFKTLRLKCENRTCFECAGRSPTWTSLTYGVFLCLTCTANHRRLGTHISFVRSCDLDGFSVPQFHNSSSLQQATQFLGLDEETSEQVSVLAEGAKQQLQGFAVTASQKVGKAREWLARNLDFPEGL
eukprot:Polyplicarium_translucidae@DN2067_c0_g1_i3.p5